MSPKTKYSLVSSLECIFNQRKVERKNFSDEIEADSIQTSQVTTKSVYSNDSINTLSSNTDTVQSDKDSGPDSAVIVATPTASESSDDGEENDEKKVSKL